MKGYPHCKLTPENIASIIDTFKTNRMELKKEVKELIEKKENISQIIETLESTIDKHSGFFSFFNNSRLCKDLKVLSFGLKVFVKSEEEEKSKFIIQQQQQQYLKDDKKIDSIIHDILEKTESAWSYETLTSIAQKFGNNLKKYREDNNTELQFCQLMELRFSQFLKLGCVILKLNDENISDIASSVGLVNLDCHFTKTRFEFDILREKFLGEFLDEIAELFSKEDSYRADQRAEIGISKLIQNTLNKETELDSVWLFNKFRILSNIPKYSDDNDLAPLIDALRKSRLNRSSGMCAPT